MPVVATNSVLPPERNVVAPFGVIVASGVVQVVPLYKLVIS